MSAIADVSAMVRPPLDPESYGREKVDEYEKIITLGEGRFAQVFLYRRIKTGELVAIKRIHAGTFKGGINLAAVCEVQVLQELHHPNIIKMSDVFPLKDRINVVLEYCPTDLETIIKDVSISIRPPDVKAYMQMMLQGLAHCHACWILHRDLKTNNLLVSSEGILKLCDFGMARPYGSPDHNLSHQVVTIWYRAPELLFGAREYGVGVDMWSVGCIFAELLLRRAFLPGRSELDQLTKIFQALGVPTEKEWPGVSTLPAYMPFTSTKVPPMEELFPTASSDAIDLMKKFFAWAPSERITAAEALKHPYFSNDPPPTDPAKLQLPRKAVLAAASARAAAGGGTRSGGAGGAGAGSGAPSLPTLGGTGAGTTAAGAPVGAAAAPRRPVAAASADAARVATRLMF